MYIFNNNDKFIEIIFFYIGIGNINFFIFFLKKANFMQTLEAERLKRYEKILEMKKQIEEE
jgi:hypothetical protein